MLRFLRIRNLAVIEAVEIEFEPGFNVLTGETGAGKSILVEAVGLLLGGRASSDLVRTGAARATIEAIFETPARELIVTREITSQGRSRSFIDGALATSAALRHLSTQLVELHGQHEHHALLDPLTHLPLLDAYAGLHDLSGRVATEWATVRTLRDQLERSRMDTRERAARLDLIDFQLGEIERVNPTPGEDEELMTTRLVLSSAERIKTLCTEGYAALYDSDQAVLAELAGIWKRVGELASIDAEFAPFYDARDEIKSQLEDLAVSLRRYGDSVDASPERLQQVEDRLAAIERLKRKHGPTLQEVIDKGQALARERDLLTEGGTRSEDLENALDGASARYLAAARELSQHRRRAATRIARELETLVGQLAMERARFELRFGSGELPESAWSERGVDAAEFFVSPNPGEDLRPLARIVSGGELSRVMLALKTMTVGDATGKTLIFDEVDAGIGGRVADVVGLKLRALGDRFQVLCITHLPQIAARGTAQFRIDKAVRGHRTVTSVEHLDGSGRVDEIARMIAGASVTDSVVASAKELLRGASPAVRARAPRRTGAKDKQTAKGESEGRRRG